MLPLFPRRAPFVCGTFPVVTAALAPRPFPCRCDQGESASRASSAGRVCSRPQGGRIHPSDCKIGTWNRSERKYLRPLLCKQLLCSTVTWEMNVNCCELHQSGCTGSLRSNVHHYDHVLAQIQEMQCFCAQCSLFAETLDHNMDTRAKSR